MTNKEELKQVILVNGWCDMPIGKLAAQAAHGSMAFLTNSLHKESVIDGKVNATMQIEEDIWEDWLKNGAFAKLALKVRSEKELEQVLTRAHKYGLTENQDYFKIIDNGRTVFNGVKTHTVTGFKPMPQSTINKVFGSLPMLKEDGLFINREAVRIGRQELPLNKTTFDERVKCVQDNATSLIHDLYLPHYLLRESEFAELVEQILFDKDKRVLLEETLMQHPPEFPSEEYTGQPVYTGIADVEYHRILEAYEVTLAYLAGVWSTSSIFIPIELFSSEPNDELKLTLSQLPVTSFLRAQAEQSKKFRDEMNELFALIDANSEDIEFELDINQP